MLWSNGVMVVNNSPKAAVEAPLDKNMEAPELSILPVSCCNLSFEGIFTPFIDHFIICFPHFIVDKKEAKMKSFYSRCKYNSRASTVNWKNKLKVYPTHLHLFSVKRTLLIYSVSFFCLIIKEILLILVSQR